MLSLCKILLNICFKGFGKSICFVFKSYITLVPTFFSKWVCKCYHRKKFPARELSKNTLGLDAKFSHVSTNMHKDMRTQGFQLTGSLFLTQVLKEVALKLHTNKAKLFTANLDWPECSPDLCPNENVWCIMKRNRDPRLLNNLKYTSGMRGKEFHF